MDGIRGDNYYKTYEINISVYEGPLTKMKNPENLAPLGTQGTGQITKKTHHYTQASTNNVNKT